MLLALKSQKFNALHGQSSTRKKSNTSIPEICSQSGGGQDAALTNPLCLLGVEPRRLDPDYLAQTRLPKLDCSSMSSH